MGGNEEKWRTIKKKGGKWKELEINFENSFFITSKTEG